MAQAAFRRVGLNIGRARARRGWIIALGAGRFGRVFRVWVWMLVTRLLGLLMVGRHRATFPVSISIGGGAKGYSCLHLCEASEREGLSLGQKMPSTPNKLAISKQFKSGRSYQFQCVS